MALHPAPILRQARHEGSRCALRDGPLSAAPPSRGLSLPDRRRRPLAAKGEAATPETAVRPAHDEASTETRAEAPTETRAEAPIETRAEASIDTHAEAPTEARAEAPIELQAEALMLSLSKYEGRASAPTYCGKGR